MNFFHIGKTIEFPISGLKNIGATCYINSIIQILGHCKGFILYTIETFTSNRTKQENIYLWSEFKDVANEMWIKGHSLIPLQFLNELQKKIKTLNINEPNDVHEVLLFIINEIADEEKKILNDNLVNTFFSCKINNEITCGHCKKCINNDVSTYIIDLEINDSTITLLDCFKQYFDINSFSDWKCDNCNYTVLSTKQYKINSLPPYLFICFKRFNNLLTKNDKSIEIPDEFIIHNKKYKYVGSIIHLGSFNMGHYITLIKQNNNQFCIYDDINLRLVNKENVTELLKKSYICLFINE
jgi:ubiquitin carboxyl-terminal hydrolase 48